MRLIPKSNPIFKGLIDKMCDMGTVTPNTFRHVAAIMKKFSFITMGQNHLRGCCAETCHGKSTRCSLHAETDAIGKAASNRRIKDRDRLDLIVIRVSPTGLIGQSKPCYTCIQQIAKARFRISKVYYSNAEGDIICENINQMIRSLKTIHIGFGLREKLGMFSGDIPIDFLQDKRLAKILIPKFWFDFWSDCKKSDMWSNILLYIIERKNGSAIFDQSSTTFRKLLS